MTDWNLLIDEADIGSVLPEAYAHYRRPIKRALTVFLEGLPEAHQEAVLLDQALLLPTASVAERLARLARSCPALHKLGQTLARDRRLLPELRTQLQRLESLPPSVPLKELRRTLTRELGRLDRLGVVLEPPALAEASVATVVPFRHGDREGVFKILKPGIEERLEQELALMQRVGAYLDEECEALGIPRLDYEEAFEGLAERLRHELRLDLEQRHLALAQAAYAGEPQIQIPTLFDFCTPRVTAMERVRGEKVTDHDFADEGSRRAVAELVVTGLLARPILSAGDEALFHGDPHAGNLLLAYDGRLAILDWSLVTTLSESRRIAFVQIVLGALMLDAPRIVAALTVLSARPEIDTEAVLPVIHAALAQLREARLPGLLWLTDLLDNAVQVGVRFDAEMLLMRKMLHTLEGVIADIGADRACIDAVLLGRFFAQMAGEWPYRWLSWADSRAFVTRLSNADLASVLASLPLTATRLWLDRTTKG
ncbi:MAG: AarF/ABC1/UbiB kinase family protein [Betaproteobacteria bacterium]|nr:AarF/ABC1/UbiB kinase family protein [Betaproteobacteria bacterium]